MSEQRISPSQTLSLAGSTMGDIYSYLREDWARSRSTLARQIDIFASEKMGLNLAPRLKQRIIARLTAAITEYDCLLQDNDTQD